MEYPYIIRGYSATFSQYSIPHDMFMAAYSIACKQRQIKSCVSMMTKQELLILTGTNSPIMDVTHLLFVQLSAPATNGIQYVRYVCDRRAYRNLIKCIQLQNVPNPES